MANAPGLLDLVTAAAERFPCKRHARELADRLPADDAGLDRLLAVVAAERQAEAFTTLLATALLGDRQVDACCLADGAPLLTDLDILVLAAGHCTGDVGSACLAAVERGRCGWEREALLLFLSAWWCKRNGVDLPKGVVREARLLCRKRLPPIAFLTLAVAAREIDDEALTTLVQNVALPPPPDELVDEFRDTVVGKVEGPVADTLAELPQPVELSGYTVRRAVAKVGRNDPCPCGSGRKYKRCCAEADRRRLRDSSDVEGLTRAELRQNLAEYLTLERLQTLRSHELVSLDPVRVPEVLRPVYINRLLTYQEHDAVLRFFETVGVPPELEDHLHDALLYAVDARRPEIVKRLLEIAGDRVAEDEVPVAARLWQLTDAMPGLDLLEAEARRCLDEGTLDLALGLLSSDVPALGILVSRGSLLLTDGFERRILLESLLETRDRLDVAPTDPIEGVVDELELVEDRGDEVEEVREELQESVEAVAATTGEIDRLRGEVGRLRRELAEREREAVRPDLVEQEGTEAPVTESAPAPAAEEDPRVGELRRRVKELREQLVERHAERNALRRQLSGLRGQADDAPGDQEPAAPAGEADDEDAGWVEDASPATHGIRIPTFASGFTASIDAHPERTVRAALALVGQLAAGTPAAFRGAKRLQHRRSIWRQKVGRNHRLLFRLDDDQLEVLALIHRQNLEKTLRTLG